jgi:acetyl esterase/lipase
MPYGYLITAVLALLCTVVALTSPRRPFALGLLSLFLGLVYNEAPIGVLLVLAASALSSLGQPGIGSGVGWFATALFLLAGAGLLLLAARGMRSAHAVSRALDDAFGSAPGAGPAAGGARQPPPWWRVVAVPWVFGRRGVVRVANLSYGDAGLRNRLDIYHRRGRPPGGPVLIHFHGGTFFRGRKNIEARSLLYRLAAEGWVCASANYRLRPAVGFPEHLIDVKRALAWIRAHGAEYGADVGTLFVAGTSAGALLAALAGLTPNDPAFQPGFEGADTSVTGVVGFSGYYGDPGAGTDFSPFAHLGAGAPPFFLAHGSRDSLVPLADAAQFADRLRIGSDNPVVFAALPGGQHSFDRFNSPRFNAVVDGVREFASRVRAPHVP